MSKIVIDETGNRHIFPDDATDSEINAQIGPPKKYSGFTPDIFKSSPYTAFLANDQARAALPSVGAFAGGVVGGIPGAAGGGAIGEGIRQAASGEKINPLGIAGQGALQGGLEAAGGLIAKGVGAAAKPVMRAALRSNVGRAAQEQLAQTALNNGILVRYGKFGLKKLEQIEAPSVAKTNALVAGAENSGTMINKSDVAARVNEILGRRATPADDKAVIARELESFLAQHPDQMEPSLVAEIKKLYQDRAVPGYNAVEKGRKASALPPQGQFNKAIASGARKSLGEAIPGYTESDAVTAPLEKLRKALETRTKGHAPPLNLLNPLTYPLGIGHAAGAVAGPAALSVQAHLLNNKAFQNLLRQSPRLAGALYKQAFYAQADATSGR